MSALVASASAAHAAGCPAGEAYVDVHVIEAGEVAASREVCVSDIVEWHDRTGPAGTAYRTRSIPGRDPQDDPNPDQALSIHELGARLAGELGGFSADSITAIDIPNPHSSYVSRLQAADLGESGSNGFENGLMPAVYFAPGFGMWYIRPLRPSPQDTNNRDWIAGIENGPLDVYLYTSGGPLRPTAHVARSTSRVGRSSEFWVTFDPPASGALEYQWTFSDGGTSNEARPPHTWAAAGTFTAYVTVNRPGQPPSQSERIEVLVEPATDKDDEDPGDKDDDETPGGGSDNPHTGPVDSEGDQAGATPDPDADPDAHVGQGGPDTTADPSAGADSEAQPPADDEPPGSAAGTITGFVLTGADAQTAEAGVPATAPEIRATNDDRQLHLPGWLVLVGAVVGLLVIGGLSESQRARGFFGRLRT